MNSFDALPAINPIDLSTDCQKIEEWGQQHTISLADSDIVLRRSLNESWFLDTLAWLLDPKGSHGLSVAFAQQFLKAIAQERTKGDYIRRNAFLKRGRAGQGTSASHFRLRNASAIREFYFPPSMKRPSIGSRYSDLVLMDLDSKDSIMVVIEGKLFTSNRPGQLSDYFHLTEEKYSRVRVREYVYLSLFGRQPELFEGENKRIHRSWIALSWTEHILDILQDLSYPDSHQDLPEFKHLLSWLQTFGQVDPSFLTFFRDKFITAASDCLLEELERLNEGKRGNWYRQARSLHQIEHSSTPSKKLRIGLLPNMSISVQGWSNEKTLFEKILIPFGANASQVYNLIDIAARNLYYLYFGDNVGLYLNKRRRRTKKMSKVKKHYRPLFHLAYKYQQELSALMAASEEAWEDQRQAEQIHQEK